MRLAASRVLTDLSFLVEVTGSDAIREAALRARRAS